MIDEGDYIALGLLVVALVGAVNWGIVAVNGGEGLITTVLTDSSNVNLARAVVGLSGLVLGTEALGVTDVTDIGWN